MDEEAVIAYRVQVGDTIRLNTHPPYVLEVTETLPANEGKVRMKGALKDLDGTPQGPRMVSMERAMIVRRLAV